MSRSLGLGLLIMMSAVGCASSRGAGDTHARYREPDYSYVDARYRDCWKDGYTEEEAKHLAETLPYTRIVFERYACYGPCPVFKATLSCDGKVRYVGKRFVPHIGTYDGEGYLLDYGKICYFIEKNNLINLHDRYSAGGLDSPGSRITITERMGRVMSIYDYGNCGPLELWVLQQTIDRYLQEIDFERISDQVDDIDGQTRTNDVDIASAAKDPLISDSKNRSRPGCGHVHGEEHHA